LVEFSECNRNTKGVPDAGDCIRARELFFVMMHQEVIFELIYGQEALQAAVHIAKVRVILQADDPF